MQIRFWVQTYRIITVTCRTEILFQSINLILSRPGKYNSELVIVHQLNFYSSAKYRPIAASFKTFAGIILPHSNLRPLILPLHQPLSWFFQACFPGFFYLKMTGQFSYDFGFLNLGYVNCVIHKKLRCNDFKTSYILEPKPPKHGLPPSGSKWWRL